MTRSSVADAAPDLEVYRRELTGFCYRMLGSGFEAEDAVQETLVRAWRNLDRFEGRSQLRSWVYRIATNVCLDMLKGPQRRARPMDLGPASTADTQLGAPKGEHAWVQPVADARVVPADGDPADIAAARESIRLAFVAALQLLPPKQRAVLILREVLHWHADEVAELLDTSVASVNSALQRARATIAEQAPDAASAPTDQAIDAEREALLTRYVEAFERYDVEALVALIHEDATFSMPPFDLWLDDRAEMAKWYTGQGAACEGSKLIPIQVNGSTGFAAYKPDPSGGRAPFAIQVLEVADGKLIGLHHFLDPTLFTAFGLPAHLD